MRIVLDTNVLYAGIRSSRGASRVILEMLADGKMTALLSPALLLEYEEQLCGDAMLHSLGLTNDDLVAKSVHVRIYTLWRPLSSDPDDDMAIECAVNGRAEAIITFNTRDLQPAHTQFGIPVFTRPRAESPVVHAGDGQHAQGSPFDRGELVFLRYACYDYYYA